MQHSEREPTSAEIEALLTDEERRVLNDPDVPIDVKNAILERLQAHEDSDRESEEESSWH